MIPLKPKQRYGARAVRKVLAALDRAVQDGLLRPWSNQNQYLRACYRGAGDPVSCKWNVMIYKPTARGTAITCVDFHVLDQLVNHNGEGLKVSGKAVLTVDDAGWGFPLCGVMVGVSDGQHVKTAVVPVRYFRDRHQFKIHQTYLGEYAKRGLKLLEEFGADPSRHRVEICTGFVNSRLRDRLRLLGYEVRVVEVTGLLQEQLEMAFRQHVVEQVGHNIYYGPKDQSDVPKQYREAVRFGQQNCPHLLKTGWASLADKCKR